MTSYLLTAAISNSVVAGLLACVVVCITRWRSNAHVARSLWLLVLVKLVTPPILPIPISSTWSSKVESPIVAEVSAPEFYAPKAQSTPTQISASPIGITPQQRTTSPFGWDEIWRWTPQLLVAIWFAGALIFVVVILLRYRAFHRMLVQAKPASEHLAGLAAASAARVGLNRCPKVSVLNERVPPFVWGLFSPQVVLPVTLANGFSEAELRSVLLHEMAHIRRGDVWLRWFETIVLAIYWWNPLAWVARAASRRAEEMCCDAAVIEMSPNNRRDYGRALFLTVEFLAQSEAKPTIFGAPFGAQLFQRRIEMVVKEKVSSSMSWWQWSALVALALVVLPLAGSTGGQEETNRKEKTPPKSGETKRSTLEERIVRLEKMVEQLVKVHQSSPSKSDDSNFKKGAKLETSSIENKLLFDAATIVKGPQDRVRAYVGKDAICVIDTKTGDVVSKVRLEKPASKVAFDLAGKTLVYRSDDKTFALDLKHLQTKENEKTITDLEVELARIELERKKELSQMGAVSQTELRSAAARLASAETRMRTDRIRAQAELREAELKLKEAELRLRLAEAEYEQLGPKYVKNPGLEAMRAKFATEEAAIQVESAKAQLQLLQALFEQQP